MNWRLRLKNKATLIAIVAAAVAFVYQILGIMNIVPPVTEEQAMQILGIIINILVGLGILVDPTTSGISDSARALTYSEPGKVTTPDDDFPMGGEGDGVDPHDDFFYASASDEDRDEDCEDIEDGEEE